ncbi:MAG: ABC transporter permease [Candidatus Marinimicrobia bacterium]|jgi:ABC-2 type transport system permease protein|nr:ABC transporter permease [Candidatus Neomarinimicrobiota bacterium]MDP6789927.1 ABC transporter permease [Candidatus Neomarinimicrobiota bacterium]MDP7071700.1 ABC transporter permease [Candidatus Neomarinimicrobiota bacterium]
MNNIAKIIGWEYKIRVRSKVFILTTILFPVLMVGSGFLSGYLADKEGTETYAIGIVDFSGLDEEYSARLQKENVLADGSPMFAASSFGNESDALAALVDETIDAFVVIPEGIMDEAVPTFYARNLSNIKIQSGIRNTLSRAVVAKRMIAENIDPSLVNELSRRVHLDLFEVDEDGEIEQGSKISGFLIPFFFMFLLTMVIFINGQLLLRSVIEERTSRMMEILLSTVTPRQLMAGKIIGLCLLAVTQVAFYIIVGAAMGNYFELPNLPYDALPAVLAFFLAGFFFYAAFYATMGTLFDSEQEAQQSMGLISIFAMVPMIGAVYFINNPGAPVTKILSFIPPITPFMMILRSTTGEASAIEIVSALGLLILCTWLMIRLAGKIFHTTVLMYGKKLSIKEIWRWSRA